MHAKAEFLKLVNWRIAARPTPGRGDGGHGLGPAAASATKVFGTEFADRGVPAADGGARRRTPTSATGSPGAVLAGRIERMHRAALILTFGGGTNEVQRDIIAAAGLGLPIRR